MCISFCSAMRNFVLAYEMFYQLLVQYFCHSHCGSCTPQCGWWFALEVPCRIMAFYCVSNRLVEVQSTMVYGIKYSNSTIAIGSTTHQDQPLLLPQLRFIYHRNHLCYSILLRSKLCCKPPGPVVVAVFYSPSCS